MKAITPTHYAVEYNLSEPRNLTQNARCFCACGNVECLSGDKTKHLVHCNTK